MPKLRLTAFIAIVIALSVIAQARLQAIRPGSSLRPGDLRCEYLANPLGIDVLRPRLSWRLEPHGAPARGQVQKAYQILVDTDKQALLAGRGNLWDSGRVNSDQSIQVEYKGRALASRTAAWWKARVWDADGNRSDWSAPIVWTMGLLRLEDWKAKWIGLDREDVPAAAGQDEAQAEHRRLAGRMLRREFVAPQKVKRATAYMCGLGFFELYLNGHKVGDRLMDPALTEYTKRDLYVTFDVTDYLNHGANAVGITLGNGRFYAPRKKVPVDTKTFGYPKLLFQMEIENEDGSQATVVSDAKWKITTHGPLRANSEYDGEEYDARLEQDGWSEPKFNDSSWEQAVAVEAPGGVLGAQMVEPIRVTQTMQPVSITNPRTGIYVVDMGQSFYGSVRLKVSGPAGTRVELRTSFSLTPEGLLKTENDRSALNTDVYILRGKEEEVWNPRFKANAYRYVQVTGFPGIPTVSNFEGLVIHTDMEEVGAFICSNPLINRIYNNARWGTRMQNRSTPMEPDRDERQGWSGHPAKTSESEAYAFNVAPFYANWLHSVRLDQHPDGSLQEVSPGYWTFNSKGTIWPAIITIIPDWYYNFYGDKRILADNYEAMKKWVLFHVREHQRPDFTTDHESYGDWVDSSSIGQSHVSAGHGNTPRRLISSAYHYHNCKILARAAKLLGKREDEMYFSDLAGKIKASFNQRFFNYQTDKYESETQASYVLPLAFGLVPEGHRQQVISNLVDEVMVKHRGHTSVGLVGMQWFMQVLTDAGHPEVAYTVATQTTRPSWGYMVAKGATTVWERWDTDTQDGGMNGESQKILSGNFEAWLYQTLGGINYDPEQPAFKHIILRPRPVGDLTFVKSSHYSAHGQIISDWKIEGDMFRWNVTLPPNTTATLYVPAKGKGVVSESGQPADKSEGVRFLRIEDGAVLFQVGSGTYSFSSPGFAATGTSIR